MYCTKAILAALLRQARSGNGATVDVTMFEATCRMGWDIQCTSRCAQGGKFRMGLRHEADIPAAQVNQVADLVDHPQQRARNRWRTVGTGNGPVEALLPPVTVNDVEAAMGDVPALGEHKASILNYGLGKAVIDQLLNSAAVHQIHYAVEGVPA